MKRFFFLLIFLGFSINSFAQISISEVSLKIGMVNNFQNHRDRDNLKAFAFSPEFEIGGKFFASFIHWGVNFSYWDDGIERPSDFYYYKTISHKDYVFGFRLITTPKIFKFFSNTLALSLVTGISYNILKVRDVSLIVNGLNTTDLFFQPYAGLQLSYKILNNFKILGESEFYINAGNNNRARIGFFVGGRYNFN